MNSTDQQTRRPARTRQALVDAARDEFEQIGYDETNSNKIARRAGFAPQTFYRHFADKVEIFLAVYLQWVAEEQALLDHVRDSARAAETAVAHHRKSLKFRRALRLLSLTHPGIRAARATSRRQQVAHLQSRLPYLEEIDLDELLARLLMVERLTDACAEGEFADLGISISKAKKQLAALIKASFGKCGASR